jgi:predicted transcriptional regulator
MAVTQDDLQSFNEFASEKLKNGDAGSLEELVQQWRVDREREEVNAAIQRGIADVDAGRTRPLEEFWDEFSQKHNISADE